jgi:hypothetical protein
MNFVRQAIGLPDKSNTNEIVRAGGYRLQFFEGFRRRQLEEKLKWEIQIK